MSYKDINEKYKKILEEDTKKRIDESKMEMDDAKKENAKKALAEYKSRKKEIDDLLAKIMKKLKIHEKRFVMGRGPDWGYVGDLGRIKENLKDINDFIRY